ncbi:hypothetical protein STENM223S_00364 [Streptomyces tendae]
MIDEFVVHPVILGYGEALRKNPARFRAGLAGWLLTCPARWLLHALQDRLLGEGELLVGVDPGPVQLAQLPQPAQQRVMIVLGGAERRWPAALGAGGATRAGAAARADG